MKRGFVREELLVVCLTKHTASAFTGHVKLDRFSVSPILPPLPFVINKCSAPACAAHMWPPAH